MNIKILDSWLKDYLHTAAKPKELAEKLSLTSVSIERIEEYKNEPLYDIEVTTNRPDLMSVVGLAREAGAVLPQFGIQTKFTPPSLAAQRPAKRDARLEIVNDPKIVHRVCAAILEVKVKPTPQKIVDRLESTGIRSLNNLIDVTNYVMRTIGHPTHVFDFDRLNTDTLIIRESKKYEEIETLDGKKYILPGGDIIATDASGRIIDLLGIMGLENSVVTDETKRILFFIDNNDPVRMRRTSMSLAIRSEAVQLNEKGVDPELAMDALLYGIQLYGEIAEGKLIADIIDLYPNKPKSRSITVSQKKIHTVIGVPVSIKQSKEILSSLGFSVTTTDQTLTVHVPSYRLGEIHIEEDVIEEIARVYGYHNLPSLLPPVSTAATKRFGDDPFYWEHRVKEAMKYWGFVETYTYSAVGENQYEGPIEEAIKIRNWLDEDHVYMRNTLVPSLLKVIQENKNRKSVKIFEIANVYRKNGSGLPDEIRMFAGIIKHPRVSFYEAKGVIEQLFDDLGIRNVVYKPTTHGGAGADISIGNENIGSIEILDNDLVNLELNFEQIVRHTTLKKTFTPLAKYPPSIEDLALIVPENIHTGDVIETIRIQSGLIVDVSLLDKYETTRTFHIVYQDPDKNLTGEEVAEIREKTLKALKAKHKIVPKE